MIKKSLWVLVLAVVFAGAGFAQDFESMPKNAITVDFGPTLVGLGFGASSSILEGTLKPFGIDISMAGVKTKGFGIGAQYERQLMEKLSVAGRFAYLTGNVGFGKSGADLNIDISSYSIEAHIRYFFNETFFLDGMLGYANMTTSFEGKVKANSGPDPSVKLSVPKDFFKLGAKVGWRIDFGNPGGFIFEPSLGWNFGLSSGGSFVDNINKAVGGNIDSGTKDILDYISWGFDNLIFVGGPRLCLAFGWRF